MKLPATDDGNRALEFDELFEKLFLLHTAQSSSTLSWDAILKQFSPGISEQVGPIDAIPGIEGYFKFCESLAKVLKPDDSNCNE